MSSRPRIESSVDLPQPDGPAIETYSPLLDLEVNAGERVRLDFVGVEDLGDALQLDQRLGMSVRAHRSSFCSVIQVARDRTRPTRTCRTRITWSPGLQALDDLDRVHRALAELHLARRASSPPSVQLEEADRALLLPERRPSDVQHVVQPFELDRAVHAQIGPRALAAARPSSATSTVIVPFCTAGSIRDHLSGDDAVARVDGGGLADLDVLGLRLGDLELRLELAGLHDLGDVVPSVTHWPT